MTKSKTIPQIRARLIELATETGIKELYDLAVETYRNSPKRKASPRSKKLTKELAKEIRAYAAANPTLPQTDIANHFKVNPGRVSEALNNHV